MRWGLLWLGSAGCLFAVIPEPGFVDTGTCDPDSCPGNYGCLWGHGCASACSSSAQCKDGFRCDGSDCVPECADEDCSPYVCDPFGVGCLDECLANSQCGEGRWCCTDVTVDRGDCKKKDLGECLKE